MAHNSAGMEFGSGLVMMCSFGDLTDIRFFSEQKIKPVILIDEQGKLNQSSGFLKGMKIKEARKAIVDMLLATQHDRLIILGDIFDRRSVSEKTIKSIVDILRLEKEVILVRGNHDSVSDRYGEISSIELVAHLLGCKLVFDKPELIDNYYIIPHMFNQEQFDAALAGVPDETTVLLHCNLGNPFVTGAHTLNIATEQINDILEKDCDVVMGHEHTARDLYGGKVKVLGCAFPTSIADCLGGDKRALLGGESIQTWSSEDYLELDFADNLDDRGRHFVSVVGTCPQNEYASVVKRIAAFRVKSDAFIIKNNVRVPEREKPEVTQEVNSFNIVDVFLSEIPEEFKGRVQACISQE